MGGVVAYQPLEPLVAEIPGWQTTRAPGQSRVCRRSRHVSSQSNPEPALGRLVPQRSKASPASEALTGLPERFLQEGLN